MDSEGRGFRNVREMWREVIGCDGVEKEQEEGSSTVQSSIKRQEWYSKGIAYWQGVDASVDGVLGGYGNVNDADVKGSEAFLQPLLAERFGGGNPHIVALDCGSGIGRVTKNLLIRHFNEVDLVEPVLHFLDTARRNLAPENMVQGSHKAANFYCVPLQDFSPECERYDVIWVQWCIGQLPDDDFVAFFKKAKAGLKPNGFFVLKENIAKSGFVLDKEDQSITRSDSYFRQLFQRCGLKIFKTKDQKGFPRELFAVKMYALVPISTETTTRVQRKLKTWAPTVIKS